MIDLVKRNKVDCGPYGIIMMNDRDLAHLYKTRSMKSEEGIHYTLMTQKTMNYINEHRIAIEALAEILEKQPTLSKEDKEKAKRITTNKICGRGVYLIKSKGGLHKIGRTSNLRSRMYYYWSEFPEEIELFAFLPTSDEKDIERALHVRFDSVRVKGEWFNLSEAHVAVILDLYGFVFVNKSLKSFLEEPTT